MFTTATIIILCYILIVIFVFFYQRNLLYHPSENNYTSEKINFSYEEVFIPTSDGKKLKACVDDLALIAGQRPIITKFKKSISNFKTRKGSNAGAKVTLRSDKMYEFIDRLITIALPRVRDFRGISPKSFDGNGNYAMGIKEHIVFPEINYDKVDVIRGMDIIICTTANTDEEAKVLLEGFNFPFRN